MLEGDRGHPYDRLVARGWPVLAASLTYVVLEALLAGAGLAARNSMTAAVAVDAVVVGLLVAAAALTGALAPDEETRK